MMDNNNLALDLYGGNHPKLILVWQVCTEELTRRLFKPTPRPNINISLHIKNDNQSNTESSSENPFREVLYIDS